MFYVAGIKHCCPRRKFQLNTIRVEKINGPHKGARRDLGVGLLLGIIVIDHRRNVDPFGGLPLAIVVYFVGGYIKGKVVHPGMSRRDRSTTNQISRVGHPFLCFR
jgi:hypothetical protein